VEPLPEIELDPCVELEPDVEREIFGSEAVPLPETESLCVLELPDGESELWLADCPLCVLEPGNAESELWIADCPPCSLLICWAEATVPPTRIASIARPNVIVQPTYLSILSILLVCLATN
jgi:hypothetical protein